MSLAIGEKDPQMIIEQWRQDKKPATRNSQHETRIP